MARDRDRGGDGKAKVRIFFAEVEGGDETIQEGLRSIAQTLIRATQPPGQVRVVKPLPINPPKQDDSTIGQPSLFQPEPESPGDDLGEELPDEASSSSIKEPRQRKPSSYSIVTDLNLRPGDKSSLKEFIAEKNPQGFQDQAVVFVYYLSKILGTPKIGPPHLNTCFKHAEFKVPTNISDVVQKVATRKGLIDTSATEGYSISKLGENYVEHELPKK